MADAVAQTVATIDADVRVKWPNDVLVDGRKVCGILLRSHPTSDGIAIVVGIGLNLRRSAEIDASATSLETVGGRVIARDEVLALLVPQVDRVTQAFESGFIAPVLHAVRRRLAFAGEAVEVIDAVGTIGGTIDGVAEDGALILHCADGTTRMVHAGEIRRGPRRFAGLTD